MWGVLNKRQNEGGKKKSEIEDSCIAKSLKDKFPKDFAKTFDLVRPTQLFSC